MANRDSENRKSYKDALVRDDKGKSNKLDMKSEKRLEDMGGGLVQLVGILTLRESKKKNPNAGAEEDFEWLKRSAIGLLHDPSQFDRIQDKHAREGVSAFMKAAEGLSVMSRYKKELLVWVKLKEVPLHIWHLKVFKVMGDAWGYFICIDKDFENKNRVDKGKMLVGIDSLRKIQPFTKVLVGNQTYAIKITIVDMEKILVSVINRLTTSKEDVDTSLESSSIEW
ncbi:protein of unknown function DUF4283 - like 10 [Theobroma cacao]|nr:protein of unknown function DUF4283 - like 10 [Theobroma cacao]